MCASLAEALEYKYNRNENLSIKSYWDRISILELPEHSFVTPQTNKDVIFYSISLDSWNIIATTLTQFAWYCIEGFVGCVAVSQLINVF